MTYGTYFGPVSIYLLATSVSTLGHIQMKLHANLSTRSVIKDKTHFFDYVISHRYISFALVAYICGGVLDLSVNRFIPFYVRACFAALDVPIYALLARVILWEIMNWQQVAGVLVAVAGCVCAVLSGAQSVKSRTETEVLEAIFSKSVAISLLITVPIFIVCLVVLRQAVTNPREVAKHDESIRSRLGIFASAVLAASIAATWASLLVRCVSELSRFGLTDPATLSMFLLLLVACVMQIATIGDMMKLFESIVTMPAYLIFNAAGLAGYSAIVFGETPTHPWTFILSLCVAFAGIALIVHKPHSAAESCEKEPLLSTE